MLDEIKLEIYTAVVDMFFFVRLIDKIIHIDNRSQTSYLIYSTLPLTFFYVTIYLSNVSIEKSNIDL